MREVLTHALVVIILQYIIVLSQLFVHLKHIYVIGQLYLSKSVGKRAVGQMPGSWALKSTTF